MAYEVNTDLFVQIRSFLRCLADRCSTCMRRNLGYCENCDARMAKMLIVRMDAKGCPQRVENVNTSSAGRMELIIGLMRKANRPLRSIEIDTKNYFSKQLKDVTLNKLISLGKVKRTKQGSFHVYSLVEGKTKKRKHKNGCN